MILPLSSQVSAPGTCHISTGPRLSTTQQLRGIRPSISSHHFYGCSPPARLSDDFYGDAPPPYGSLPPLGGLAPRATRTEGPRGNNRTGRRVKSESCAATYHSHDDDFLANLAAIKLLSGCTAGAAGQTSIRRPCCGNGCDGNAFALEDLSSKLFSQHHTRPLTIPLEDQTTLHSGADGYVSLESTDGVQTYAHRRSTPTTPLFLREQVSSEDLDRRLRSIDDSLRRDTFPTGFSNMRLHTSEVSRKEQSLTADDTVDTHHPRQDHNGADDSMAKNASRGILGTLRSLQHKDRSRRSVATFPSLDPGETPSQYESKPMASRRILNLKSKSY
jgi:hypothetical protein